jgi:hypothetical protein
MTRFAAAALMWGAVTLGSCSIEHLGASSDGNADTPPGLDGAGADRCSGSISDVGGRCQASFDGSVADLLACSGVNQTVKLCGDVIALGQSGGFTALTCYYDTATHLLVGAREQSDTTEFCGDSFARFAGQVPGNSCDAIAPSLLRSCSNRDGAVTTTMSTSRRSRSSPRGWSGAWPSSV